jgi:hypothetical protein
MSRTTRIGWVIRIWLGLIPLSIAAVWITTSLLRSKPVVLALCQGASVQRTHIEISSCSAETLALRTGAECDQALAVANWALSAGQRVRWVQHNLWLVCMPAEDARVKPPSPEEALIGTHL